jgi:predicted ATPase
VLQPQKKFRKWHFQASLINLQFDGAGMTEVAYEDTEHFAVTRDFLNHYPRRLEQLLADE